MIRSREGLTTQFLVLGLFFASGAAVAQNLVVNPEFNNGFFGWTAYGECNWTGDDGHAAPGAAKCRVDTAVFSGSVMSQCLPATAGVPYDFGGFVRLSSVPHPTATAYLYVSWRSDVACGGSQIGSTPGSQETSATTWTGTTALLQVAPPGTKSARLTLFAGIDQPYTGVFDAYFDDIFYQPSCSNTREQICVTGSRFVVDAFFRTAGGQTTSAKGVRLTSDSGYFTFFSPDNPELFVKVINACSPPFNRYWVFIAGLTNVEVRVNVTDTKTKQVKHYDNALNNRFVAVQDTNAFMTCP